VRCSGYSQEGNDRGHAFLDLGPEPRLSVQRSQAPLDGFPLLGGRRHGEEHTPRAERETLRGKTVCFTGKMLSQFKGERVTRELAEKLAAEAGLAVQATVTKRLDLLVVADPDTQSGKAKKARQYGVRIMAEAAFWNALGLPIE